MDLKATDPRVLGHDDGYLSAVEIAEPCWLFVTRVTNLETGKTTVSVYRSLWLDATSDSYQRVIDIVGDAEPYDRCVFDDPSMMFHQAELLLYDVDCG